MHKPDRRVVALKWRGTVCNLELARLSKVSGLDQVYSGGEASGEAS